MKTASSWAVFTLGVVVGLCGLILLGAADVFYYPAWMFVGATGLFGLIPLIASFTAFRNRKRAALLFLCCAPFAAGAYLLCEVDYVRQGGILWQHLLFNALMATSVAFILPGVFWLLTGVHHWPPISWPFGSLSRITAAAIIAVVLLTLVLFVDVGLALMAGPPYGDCGYSPPMSHPRYPSQGAFVAKVVATVGPCMSNYDGTRLCADAVAVVKEKFWGVHSPVVLLTQGVFKRDEDYLIDGVRTGGVVTHFLPIFGFRHCTHSAPLRLAKVELRVLRDHSPQNGFRIVGEVVSPGHIPVPGTMIALTGPSGPLFLTTDNEGIFDAKSLPEGDYQVQVGAAPVLSGHQSCNLMRQAFVDKVGSCQFWLR